MPTPSPTPSAFLCYAHFDDDHDGGFLSKLRRSLEGELRVQTGQAFAIFQDRRDIHWGQQWKEQVDGALDAAVFLIPILTPSFFASRECRREVEIFQARERARSRSDLILPLYYISTALLDGGASADDPFVEFLRARQYVDWRPLRHVPLSNRKGRLAVSDLARRLDEAVQRVDPPSRTLSKAPAAPRSPQASALDEAGMLRAVVDRDPLVALEGARHLLERPDLIADLISQSAPSPVGETAVRSVTRHYPEIAAPLLLAKITQVGLSEQAWGGAVRALPYFDRAHGPICEAALGEHMRSGSVDKNRMAVAALGRCATMGWCSELRRLLASDSTYELEKLGSYVIDALGGIFVRSADSWRTLIDASSYLLDEIAHLSAKYPNYVFGSDLGNILQMCDGRHADVLIAEWLSSDSSRIVELGAEVLGALRILRAVRPLIQLLNRASEQGIVRTVSSALGMIGNDVAIQQLLSAEIGSDASYGLVHALDRIESPAQFKAAASRLLAGASGLEFLVVRAIGRRGANEFESAVRKVAEAPDPVDRGVAALALARLGRAPRVSTLQTSLSQAANAQERVFTTLAILTIDPSAYAGLEVQLRQDLGENSFSWWSALQTDVLEVLYGTGEPEARRLADAWRPFYPHAASGPEPVAVELTPSPAAG